MLYLLIKIFQVTFWTVLLLSYFETFSYYLEYQCWFYSHGICDNYVMILHCRLNVEQYKVCFLFLNLGIYLTKCFILFIYFIFYLFICWLSITMFTNNFNLAFITFHNNTDLLYFCRYHIFIINYFFLYILTTIKLSNLRSLNWK